MGFSFSKESVYPCHDQAADGPPNAKAFNPVLNESGLNPLDDDIDDSIIGPTESTSVYDLAKIARGSSQHPAAKRNILQDWDMTRIESAADKRDGIDEDDEDGITHASSMNLPERVLESDGPNKTVQIHSKEGDIKGSNEDNHFQTSPERKRTVDPYAQEDEAMLAGEKIAPSLSLSFDAPGLVFNPNDIFEDVPIKTEVEREGFVTLRKHSAKKTDLMFETGVEPNTETDLKLSRNWVPIKNAIKPKVCRPLAQVAQEEKPNKKDEIEHEVDIFDFGPKLSIFEDGIGKLENAMSRENAKFSIFQVDDKSVSSNLKSLGAFAPIENPLKKPGAAESEQSNKSIITSLKPRKEPKDDQSENEENFGGDEAKSAGRISTFTDSFADSEMLSPGPKMNLMGPPTKPVVRMPLQSSKILKPSAGETKIQQQLPNNDQSQGQRDSLKRQPLGPLTPEGKDKQSRFQSPVLMSCEPKSLLWAPSPTIHTKLAQQEVDAMYQQTLDHEREEFSLTQAQDSLSDFEQQFNTENHNPGTFSSYFNISL